ncbi:MFS transporter [Rossellomorea aquimaris]|uniref:MFS transporter n=1 Tax=Rossellomorea aquimaris TaxID=189382 RepID=UPI001CD42291|nr:MFS transporter [Rossellomorea aquimaris]MCA1053616.1 MFS transporter [Rossellomorea aquimaris]
MRWFVISQSFAMTAASVSFPFYLLFIQNIGRSFSSFGFAYGLFTLSAALSHRVIGRLADHSGGVRLLILYAIGMSLVFLVIPSITSIEMVYLIQMILGILGALQKTSEKLVISEMGHGDRKGALIGHYHFWTSLCSSIAVMATGYMLNYFTIGTIFYGCSLFFLASGICLIVYYDGK